MDYQLTKEQGEQLYNIALGIARKKYHTYRYYGIDVMDMASELYIRGFELCKKSGEFNPGVIAKALYNDVVDIIRYNQRRVHKSTDPTELDWDQNLSDTEFNRHPLSHNTTELADLNDVLNAAGKPNEDFPSPNTTNKIYWYIWLTYKLTCEYDTKVLDRLLEMPENAWMHKPKWQAKLEKKQIPVDDIIATTLGYAGNHSTGYQKIKRAARELLKNEGFYSDDE